MMVRAAIAAEEEYKDMLCTYAGAPAPVHSSIAEPSLIGHVPSKPAPDGHLLVHPLVLDVELATLQAAILKSPNRDASVDRSPPAATLHQPVGGWPGRQSNRGPSARLLSLPSQPHHLLGPSHSRPPPAVLRVPPVSAHVGYITVQGATGTSPRSRPLTPRDTARATWMLACGWGKCSTAQPRSTPTHDRHTQGSPWYVGGGHARAGTRSRTRTRSR